jgi:hypothetical protein
MARRDIQEFLKTAVPKRETAGRAEVAVLKRWLGRTEPAASTPGQ